MMNMRDAVGRNHMKAKTVALFSTLWIALFVALGLSAVEGAQAHTRYDKQHWFWAGSSTHRDDADKLLDPTNVVFLGSEKMHWGTMSDMLDDNPGDLDEIEDLIRPVVDGRQRLTWYRWFKDDNGGLIRMWDKTSDMNDRTLGTNNKIKKARDHMRLWDAEEHDNLYSDLPNHKELQFYIGTGHHDIEGHKVKPSIQGNMWDNSRYIFRDHFKLQCSWPRWRKNPFADREYQGIKNSGWMMRISAKKSPGC